MDNRRRNGLIALVVLVTAVVALVYYQTRGPDTAPTTAFAPAQSADESVPPADTPIEPPADVAAAIEAEAVEDGSAAVADGPADGGSEAAAVGTGHPSEVASADAPAEPEIVEEPETDTAMLDPSTEAAPGDETELIVPSSAVPTFDIVRVEPSGDTVIAGQAEPSALVEIMDGPEVIATAEANEAGEWVIALDEPLDPGTHDLAISTTSPDESVVTLSDQRVTVSVPEEGSTDVLVVLNAPDMPSTVIQVPSSGEIDVAVASQEPEPSEQAEVASAPDQPATEQAPVEQDVAMAEPASETPMPDQPQAETEISTAAPPQAVVEPGAATVPAAEAGGMEVAAAPAGAPAATAGEPAQEAASAHDVAPEPPTETEVAVATSAEPSAGDAPETTGPATVAIDDPMAAEEPTTSESEVAVATDVVEEPVPPPPPEPLVLVAAVEAESDGALYVAGTATTGETVRVYLDGTYVGDAIPSPSGTWLVETTIDLPAGEYLIRADQVAEDGSVIARYEVPFDREVEVAVLRPTATMASAEGASLTGAMPEVETVIIKRGDNLWRIARAAWGKGVRWSTIYEANDDLIRDPHWIYPGQVFVMPKGDATWEN